jgi:predicted enzyme related to lactoylglutathione lyase
MAHGEYNHVEIPADDPGRAQRFYEGVFGWGFTEMEGFPDYFLYRSGPGDMGGAIGKRGESAGTVLRAYVSVDAIDASLAKVNEHGGTTTLGRTEVPGQGWYAVIHDSEGNEIGLWERLPR